MHRANAVIAWAYRLQIPDGLQAVGWFCLLGLAVSAAIVPLFPADSFDWLLVLAE